MPGSQITEADPGDNYGKALHLPHTINMLTLFNATVAVTGGGADDPRPRGKENNISLQLLPGGHQSSIYVDRFQISTESMAAGYGPFQ